MSVELRPIVDTMPSEAGDSEFLKCWAPVGELIGERQSLGRMALLEVMRDAAALQSGSVHPAWGGGWRWDMSKGVAKSVLASGILYGVLVSAGVPGLLPLVVPAIIPLLFEVEKVRLTRTEGNVIDIIGARKNAFDRGGTVEQLYQSLPSEIKQSISKLEFAEFLDKATAAGVASEYGDVIQVLSTGESVFRLKVV